MLTMATKRQIINKQKTKYLRSGKKEKSKILTALEETTGLTRGHLIRALSKGYEYEDEIVKLRILASQIEPPRSLLLVFKLSIFKCLTNPPYLQLPGLFCRILNHID